MTLKGSVNWAHQTNRRRMSHVQSWHYTRVLSLLLLSKTNAHQWHAMPVESERSHPVIACPWKKVHDAAVAGQHEGGCSIQCVHHRHQEICIWYAHDQRRSTSCVTGTHFILDTSPSWRGLSALKTLRPNSICESGMLMVHETCRYRLPRDA